MKSRSWILVVATLLLSGCTDEFVTPAMESPPVVGNAPDSFGFAVSAASLDLDEVYTLDFSGERISVGLAVVGYGGGDARIELLDEGGEVLYSRDLGRNIAEGSDTIFGRPVRATLRFSKFSGIVSLGISTPR